MKKRTDNDRDISVLIGEAVEKYRKKTNLTQIELAKKSRLSKTSIEQIESGFSNPPAFTIYKIAKAMGIDTCRLLGNM